MRGPSAEAEEKRREKKRREEKRREEKRREKKKMVTASSQIAKQKKDQKTFFCGRHSTR